MKYLKSIVLIVGAIIVAGNHGISAGLDPVTITFGETNRDIGDLGPTEESGYRYEAFGASWALISTTLWAHGGDGSALFTFFGIQPEVGNMAIFQRVDQNPFLFQSLELRGRLDEQRNSVLVAHGFLDGVEVASQLLQSSNETWRVELAHPSFLTPIDELRFEVVEVNGAALMLDNLVFAPVPEPSVCVLLALGVSAFAWMRTRRVS